MHLVLLNYLKNNRLHVILIRLDMIIMGNNVSSANNSFAGKREKKKRKNVMF